MRVRGEKEKGGEMKEEGGGNVSEDGAEERDRHTQRKGMETYNGTDMEVGVGKRWM